LLVGRQYRDASKVVIFSHRPFSREVTHDVLGLEARIILSDYEELELLDVEKESFVVEK
jgi:hypothetical protein